MNYYEDKKNNLKCVYIDIYIYIKPLYPSTNYIEANHGQPNKKNKMLLVHKQFIIKNKRVLYNFDIYWRSWLYTTPTCLRTSSSSSASRRESAWDITALSFSPTWENHIVRTCAVSKWSVFLMPPCVESITKICLNIHKSLMITYVVCLF